MKGEKNLHSVYGFIRRPAERWSLAIREGLKVSQDAGTDQQSAG